MKNNKKKLKAPKLRFPEFTDDWEECSLNKFTEYESSNYSISQFNECNLSGKYKVFDVNKEIACIDEFDQLNEYISIIKDGAGIGRTEIRPEKSSVIGTMGYIKSINSDIYFVYSLIKNVKWNKYKNGSTIPHVYYKDYGNEKFFIPNKDEQAKIGKFFKEIDQLITLNQNKISHIKDLKAGLLQKMFPKNGETKPEIRFDGFTSDWKKRKLGEVKDVRDGTHDSPKYQNKGFPLITSKNIKESGLDMSNVSLISFEDFNAINQRSKVDIGDIIFGMIGTIGNPIILERDDFAIKNVALLKNGGSIDNRFLLQLLKSPVFELYMKKENAGGTQKFLGLSQIRNLNFLVPELSEQQKIGEFFSQLDNLLTLYKRKLEHLQEQKKSLLKQMFI